MCQKWKVPSQRILMRNIKVLALMVEEVFSKVKVSYRRTELQTDRQDKNNVSPDLRSLGQNKMFVTTSTMLKSNRQIFTRWAKNWNTFLKVKISTLLLFTEQIWYFTLGLRNGFLFLKQGGHYNYKCLWTYFRSKQLLYLKKNFIIIPLKQKPFHRHV